MSQIIEKSYTGAQEVNLININLPEAQLLKEKVNAISAFGKQHWTNFPYIWEIKDIVYASYGVNPTYLDAINIFHGEREWRIPQQELYERLFYFNPSPSAYPVLPFTHTIMHMIVRSRVAGFPGLVAVEDIAELYFSAEPSVVEAAYNLNAVRGAYTTIYRVTFSRTSKEISSITVYAYDDAYWPESWAALKQAASGYS